MRQTSSSNQRNKRGTAAGDGSAPKGTIQFSTLNLLGEPVLPSLQDWRDAHKAAQQGNQHPLRHLMTQIPSKIGE